MLEPLEARRLLSGWTYAVTITSVAAQQLSPSSTSSQPGAAPASKSQSATLGTNIGGVTGRNAVVFTDADNTLWDTNSLYATAQLNLLERVEAATGHRATGDRLAFVRVVDQQIAKRHPLGLRYPPQLLVMGLVEALAVQGGVTSKPSTASAMLPQSRPTLNPEKEAAKYLEAIGELPPLRPGVRSGLERLHDQGIRIIIITEGSETTALKRLNHHGLLPLVDHVIEGVKSPDLYMRLAKEHATSQPVAFMIGDQLDRDIVFASKAGFSTIYFPGGFTPAWMPDVADAKPDYQIVSYDEVVAPIVRRLNK